MVRKAEVNHCRCLSRVVQQRAASVLAPLFSAWTGTSQWDLESGSEETGSHAVVGSVKTSSVFLY